MKHAYGKFTPYFLLTAMMILIFDSRTALGGALAGVELCFYTVIPSLFPLMVLSTLLVNSFPGQTSKLLSPIGKLCGIPAGAEPILITGLLGGYPVGAMAVSSAYKTKRLSKQDANRMLRFCSNCGPAFIFGICSILFSNKLLVWFLWLIHIFSAILTGAILPGKSKSATVLPDKNTVSISAVLANAIYAMATVCGWIILFKTIANFMQKWFMWLLPATAQTILYGSLELTNGLFSLLTIPNEGTRFLLASVFLSFGGLCVCMQTFSQIGNLSIGSYLLGKTIQMSISIVLSAIVLMLHGELLATTPLALIAVLSCVFLWILLYFHKKTVDFSKQNVYNGSIKPVVR